jgi:exonuclease SbcC
MIPRRVKLSGFLCYKDEQEVRFDGSALWMLAGLNGSGKSTVFDAVTFALFGHHRGGAQQPGELINKDRTQLAVEFEFRLDGCDYLARRTVRRSPRGAITSTQQILAASGDDWVPVPDTNLRDGFRDWVAEHVGLSYETFTSSVLLLQGRAEKLLDSTPAGRAQVLAGIVDLDRFQRLFEKADARRKSLKGQLDAYQRQLDAIPEVSAEEAAVADLAAGDAEDRREKASEEVDRLQALGFLAKRWAEAQGKLTAQGQRVERARGLVRDAATIEKDVGRLRELREALPHVRAVLQERNRIRESEARTTSLTRDRAAAADQARKLEHAQTEARRRRDNLQQQLTESERKQQELNARLRDATAAAEQVKLFDEQSARLTDLEAKIKRLPERPFDAVEACRRELEELAALAQTVPQLARFAVQRSELVSVTAAASEACRAEKETEAAGKLLAALRAEADARLRTAVMARRTATDAAAEARALAQQAGKLADEFRSLGTAKTCRACGQALTREHFEAEKQRRTRDLAAAEARQRDTEQAARDAEEAEQNANKALADLDARLAEARDRFSDCRARRRQADADAERLRRDLGQVYHELPAAYRTRVSATVPADWTATAFPSDEDLGQLRNKAAGHGSAKRRMEAAEKVQADWSLLRGQAEAARETVARLRSALPAGDPAAVQARVVQLRAEEESVARSVKAARDGIRAAQADLDRLARDLAEVQRGISDLDGKLRTEEAVCKMAAEAVVRALKSVPVGWRDAADQAGMREHSVWQAELDDLVSRGVEQRAADLQLARSGLAALEQTAAELEAECEATPPEARRDPEELRTLWAAARKALEAADAALRDARQRQTMLDGRRKQREAVLAQAAEADREHKYHDMLAKLLGRDRLQRHLVRQAERQIVDHANAVLDRLSGGQLALQLVGGDDGAGGERALELEAFNRVTGGAAINVAFLSGSQRFRVAVSLALGIGQYASRQHRPIEAVIIDEGFGCLDRQGRQVMIQELQNLRGHLHCILLVSHQEEFAEAFSDGYLFELTENGTQVKRVQR